MSGLLLFILILNTIYDVKDWISKYDYMSMNFPAFMLYIELYMYTNTLTLASSEVSGTHCHTINWELTLTIRSASCKLF